MTTSMPLPQRLRAQRRAFFPTLLMALALGLSAQAQAPQSTTPTLQRFATGFVSPMVLAPLDDSRLLLADQIGIVHVLDRAGTRRSEPFLDLRAKLCALNRGFDERGLLGLALHPRFAENRKLYLYYSAPLRPGVSTNWNHTAHLSEFTATPDAARVPLASERVLLAIDQPYFNHNGGRLAFGPDGLLYLGLGDGGNGNDQGHDRSPAGNGQDLTTLLGKIVRIDVDRPSDGNLYGIPSDNPLRDRRGARPEIFAWGLRNPWGMTFDRGGSHDLIAADVGQGRYEEINVIRKGANYGWNQREGFHAFDPKNPGRIEVTGTMQPSDRSELADPVLEYKNLNGFPKDADALGISVTGGYVYRGKTFPQLAGRYVFADWSRQWAVPDGRLYVATPVSDRPWKPESLPVASHADAKLGAYVLAFGEDQAGELYVLTTQRTGLIDQTGVVWKLAPSPKP